MHVSKPSYFQNTGLHEQPLQYQCGGFDQWDETAEECFNLDPNEQEPKYSDCQHTKILIGGMAGFFEKDCIDRIPNYSILSREPLSYEACKLALWIFKEFNAMIVYVEEPERDLEFTVDPLSKLPHQLSVIEISKKSLNALVRHTQELKLKEQAAEQVAVTCLAGCKQQPLNDTSTEDKSCYSYCTLF